MFTGIIEDIGEIKNVQKYTDALEFVINAPRIMDDIHVNDSISIDGACQTVIKCNKNDFTVQAVGETLQKTTLGQFNAGRKVNLERSLTLNSRIGGHFVQGHITTVAKIINIKNRGNHYYFEIGIPASIIKYCTNEGSIAVDGISLTIAKVDDNKIGISIIPHTFKNTTLSYKKLNDSVNIETDIIARQIEQLLTKSNKLNISSDKLRNWGY